MTAPAALAISFVDTLPTETFNEFRRLVDVDDVGLQLEAREEPGAFAAMEWLLPTAVIVFIGKAYFESFLKEAGKDHYALLKSGLKSLFTKLVGPEAPKVTVVATEGKALPASKYSLMYSLLAEGEGELRFKLLLQQSASASEYEATIDAFLQFLADYHEGTLGAAVIAELESTRVVGRTLLLAFSPSLGRVQPIDPMGHQSSHGA